MIPGYEITTELFSDERYIVYRGRRRKDGILVLVKTPRHDPARPAELAALERECRLLQELQIAGIARPRELIRSDSHCALVLEDRGGLPLGGLVPDYRGNLNAFFPFALPLASLLIELHRRDIILNNLSPRSILINPGDSSAELIDLSLALRVAGETHTPLPAHVPRGLLAYLSPEQTGRINHATDYRTDFYSLGITLYELLTGAPPFASDDTLELIHWHIARRPLAPAQLDPTIPEALSRIIMKLLAKTAEERYQSALGLRKDLEICADKWAASGSITSFPLAQHDISDRFLIPKKLYGREREVETLRRAFEQSCQGRTNLLLVAGYSGIGKTSLIQELCKPIIRERGYFIAGKFDQIVRLPYHALLQAFRELIQQLLTESEARLAGWRARLSQALGGNGGVLAEVIPEIELILGKQPIPPVLGPVETQNRFQRVLQTFLAVFARRDHPLVVFLDDLQWAGTATLSLLQPLLTSPDIRYLLLIGAYRDNEVDAGHPLTRTLSELEAAGAGLRRIVLEPLGFAELNELIRDILHGEPSDIEPLAELVLRKTGANPFFVIQFLKALRQDGLLQFDYRQSRWTFHMEAINGVEMTDNVIELMARKIRRLSAASQKSLRLAACIGSEFDLETLAIVSQQSVEATAASLDEALAEGLVLAASRPYDALSSADSRMATPAASTYTFLHDRVQQAAYAQIPDADKEFVHLTVGRLLLAQWSPETAEEKLFDIVHHLNLGGSLISAENERLSLARLNLQAGRKAKSSTAYQAALDYLNAGIGMLAEHHWSADYELALALHLEAAECEHLCGHFETAERAFGALLKKVRTPLDKAQVYSLKSRQDEYLSCYTDAIRSGEQGLALFGISFPDTVEGKQRALEAELATIQTLMGERPIEALIDLPIMQNPEIRMAMRLLTSLHTPCYLSGDKLLTLLNTATMVRLSLVHGNIEQSALAYVLHAMHLGPIRGEYQAAYEFGLLALRLNERLHDPGLRAKILMNFSWAVSIWRRPIAESFAYTREAFRLGNETGLFSDAAYAIFNETYFTLLAARELSTLQPVCEAGASFARRVKMQRFADAPQVIQQWGLALQGLTGQPTSLSNANFDEAAYRRTHDGANLFEMFFFIAKLALFYTFGEYRAACEMAREAERVIQEYTGTIWDELRVFYHALALAALWPEANTGEREEAIATLRTLNARLQHWAENSPYNFQSQHLSVSAEIARVDGRAGDAMTLYEAAIAAAADHECPRERALANELCARFWRGRGQIKVAAVFMAEARGGYLRWGAVAKVDELERGYPDLLIRQAGANSEYPATLTDSSTGRISTEIKASTLDLLTIVKAGQAISGEIELERLLEKLLRIAIENAGADRGSLILERDGQALVYAEGTVAAVTVWVHGISLGDTPQGLPLSLVNYVRRTVESVVLADARNDDRYAGDPYILREQPLSILCTPVLNQGRLIGILYLENHLSTHTFTPARIELMQILASQAAISLENAALYEDRRRAEEALRQALSEVEQLKNRLQAENVYLQEEILTQHNFQEMVGNSPALLAMLRRLESVARTDATVLVQGETGTGKELIARAIHDRSARRDRALVKVNCAAISAGLVESELFGHVKGAFTGALEKRIGRFELADGGTIFLDEIGELPLETQVKLLRVLQEQEFEPVGSSRTRRVDVRVIAATNRNLQEAVHAGRFRSDLYYRLNVFPIMVPALRERREDIPQLVLFFLARYAKKCGKPVESVNQASMDSLAGYAWPGNIRELQNTIERAVILSQGTVLEFDQDFLPAQELPKQKRDVENVTVPGSAAERESAAPMTLDEAERSHIIAILKQTNGVIEGAHGAARVLSLKPSTLRARMKKLGIGRASIEGGG